MSYPWRCSSVMAARSCGIDALMFGSLMMLAADVFATSPSHASSSGTRWCSVNRSGKAAMIRPASEMSRVSNSTPVPRA